MFRKHWCVLSLSLVCAMPWAVADKGDVLHLYNWNNALAPDAAKRFEASCGCRLTQDYYGDNEEMLAKLAAGAKGYDMVFPTAFAMETLIKQKRLKPLDRRQISNWKNLDPQYLKLNEPFDPQNRYGAPTVVTPVMLGYNETRLKEAGVWHARNTWALIFNPAILAKIKGRVTVLDSQRELVAAALLYLGKDPNSTRPQDWEAAKRVILRAKPYWAAFNNQSYIKELTVGNIWVSHGYSSDFFQAMQDAKHAKRPFNIGFSLQKEGNALSVDNMVVLKDAPRPDLAHQFINFMLEGRNAADASNLMGATNPVRAAKAYFIPEVKNNPVINLELDDNKKLHLLKDLDRRARRNLARLWTQIKVSR